MKTYCEIVVKYILPGIRAIIAKDLIETYKLTQKEAAKRLGMTQPAISQYKKHLRGRRASILENDREINEKISILSKSLAERPIDPKKLRSEFCNICEFIRKKYGKSIEEVLNL